MNKPFRFKQFSVHQDQCAMKIGTDGVLLGAWAPIDHRPFSILDIGAGTGILSLMLAQRCDAQVIEALEIDDKAYEQCVENFEQSPWNDRLFCYHASLEEFALEIEDKYDLIICNPPFYSEDYKTDNSQRDLARFQDAMPFNHLLDSVATLLSKAGLFSVVIPFSEAENFIALASQVGLFPKKKTHIKGALTSKVKRSLITFSFREQDVDISELIIETSRHNYTEDYINLTKDFYLKM
ncbi:tRNA1(Val) (adenine(37)-N6)-methyltransferase [Psychroserpens damuponensis]|uniref:tRNA1(Val) (adenine(37)-N6)-methyltransferase n=1 Tax=Psychroserpens damuponensis TaxID=943936 RepID=UPI00058E868A|nr:methyltransferase [Psychroserpens damuponensis]